MNNNQAQNINRYLNNEMSETERLAFETEMRQDEALANEVKFQRGFVGFFGRYQPNLETKLDNLGNEYILNTPKEKSYKWLLIFGLLLLSAIVFYVIFNNKTASTIDTNTDSNSIIEVPQEIPNQTQIIDEDTTEIKENNTIPQIPSIDKFKPIEEKPATDNQPIAGIDESFYERNSNMELLLESTVRANNDVQLITIVEPVKDAIISITDLVDFRIKGTAKNPLDYDIIIFNNQDFNINNNYPILKIAGKSTQEQGENRIEFNAKLPLENGLYYLIIQPKNSRQVLHISRFEVR